MDYHFIVVGCGGTGGHFLIQFGRYLYRKNVNYDLLIIDQDRVEKENIIRQPFQKEDIGRFKAEVMTEILQVFGIDAAYLPKYVKKADDVKKYVAEDGITILISAVDNHPCRAVLHKVFMETQTPIIYLDSANGKNNGELVVGARYQGQLIAPDRAYYYPEVLTEKQGGRHSCASQAVHSPQQITANLMAANLLLHVISDIMERNILSSGIYFFNLGKGYLQFRPWKGEKEDGNRNVGTI